MKPNKLVEFFKAKSVFFVVVEFFGILVLTFFLRKTKKELIYNTYNYKDQIHYLQDSKNNLEKKLNTEQSSEEKSDEASDGLNQVENIQQINSTEFIYTKDYKDIYLYEYDYKNNKQINTKIGEGFFPSVSHDKKKIAYAKSNLDTDSDPNSSSNVYIYNLADQTTQTIKLGRDNYYAISSVEWSPDDQNLVINDGSGVIRNISIYNLEKQKNLIHFSLFGGQQSKLINWIDNDRIIFNEPQKVSPKRPYQDEVGRSISIISISNNQKIVLKEADSLNEYQALTYSNGMIYFSKKTIQKIGEGITDKTPWDSTWSDNSKVSETFWKMNINGDNLQEINEDDVP